MTATPRLTVETFYEAYNENRSPDAVWHMHPLAFQWLDAVTDGPGNFDTATVLGRPIIFDLDTDPYHPRLVDP